jgi:hypothetical protein
VGLIRNLIDEFGHQLKSIDMVYPVDEDHPDEIVDFNPLADEMLQLCPIIERLWIGGKHIVSRQALQTLAATLLELGLGGEMNGILPDDIVEIASGGCAPGLYRIYIDTFTADRWTANKFRVLEEACHEKDLGL